MKLSLNELCVDSYATQLNEKEITEIKGGTTDRCIEYGHYFYDYAFWDEYNSNDNGFGTPHASVLVEETIHTE